MKLLSLAVLMTAALCCAPAAALEVGFGPGQSMSPNDLLRLAASAPAADASASGRFVASSTWLQDQQLVALMRDPDPGVRAAALRYARSMPIIQNRNVRGQIAAMAADEADLGVRLEAVRTLYWVSQYNEEQRRLLALARGDREPRVRAMALKVLHTAAKSSSLVWREVLDLTRNEADLEVRKAAIWGLFECAGLPDVRRVLLDMIWDGGLDTDLRVEAVKSLFGGMGHSDAFRDMIRLAKDEGQPKALRLAGILVLSGAQGSEISRTVEGLLRNADPEVRAAALKAGGGMTDELRRFFHLGRRLDDRTYVSPIEEE